MITGQCLCGAARWTFDGNPGAVTACNCTLCRRYGVLWAYDYENGRIHVEGLTSTHTRAEFATPTIELHFCPTCGCLICWRGVRLKPDGRRRMAVNIRLAPPEDVAGLAVRRLDGLDSFQYLPLDGRCVRDTWF
jgi:hypothetical protein